MQIAAILSDLTSFRLCGHEEALALVHAAKETPTSDATPHHRESSRPTSTDADLTRAYDLMELHRTVKLQHVAGEDLELRRVREDVNALIKDLRTREQGGRRK
ncbi:MAG: hypothetical protein M1817_004964 [Caeruleum heppii]|nr:MAG: hypothetical protein M1817_004964 [Caeruleum heppii]